VRAIKQKVFDEEGIPPEAQKIYHSNVELDDDKTLKENGVKDMNLVFIAIKNEVYRLLMLQLLLKPYGFTIVDVQFEEEGNDDNDE
jgi:hypothetical protein